MEHRVYVSGPLEENLLPPHRELRDAILQDISSRQFELRGFFGPDSADGFNWDTEGIRSLIARCHGMVMIALPRWHLSDLKGHEKGAATTEYTHVEGTLAVARSLPVLAIRHEDVRPRGILGHEMTGRGVEIPQAANAGWLSDWRYKQAVDAWASEVRKSRDVFLGYSSEASSTANDLTVFLQGEGVAVLDWKRDFEVGELIIDQIREAARRSTCGIFLFTKDDALAGKSRRVAPRDNVIFEAGYFASAKGQSRTLIVLEAGAKFPADLGGDIYLPLKDRHAIGPIETALRKKLQAIGVL